MERNGRHELTIDAHGVVRFDGEYGRTGVFFAMTTTCQWCGKAVEDMNNSCAVMQPGVTLQDPLSGVHDSERPQSREPVAEEVTMTAKTVHQAPSQTALAAAFYRAMAHKDTSIEGIGSDHLAWTFLSGAHRFLVRLGWIRRAIRRKSERITPGVYEYVRARTAFFDERYARALDDGTEQIVLLGAGYDTRPRRMPSPDGLKVIELDVAPTQERKRGCLERAGLAEPAGLVFAPIDFNAQSIATVLREAGYNHDRKTLFLWEGVTYYLTGDAVDDVLRLVRENNHPETTIVFDHAITLSEENIDRIHGARTFSEMWDKHNRGEPFKFFIDRGALPVYLNERGLDLVEHLDASEMESVYSTDKVTGFFRLAVARPTAR